MKLKHEDGRDLGDDGMNYEAGDFVINDGAAFVVQRIEGGTAHVVDHPESVCMLAVYNEDYRGGDDAIERCARIHWQAMAQTWLAARDIGIVGTGRYGSDLRLFAVNDEHVVAADETDAVLVLREHCGWKSGDQEDDIDFEDLSVSEVESAAIHEVKFEPVMMTAAQWCAVHGRGWLSGET